MALGADHVQAASLPHLPLLMLDHGVVFGLDPGDHRPQSLQLRIAGRRLLGRLGDVIFQLQQRQAAVTPGLDQIAGQLPQGLIGGIR